MIVWLIEHTPLWVVLLIAAGLCAAAWPLFSAAWAVMPGFVRIGLGGAVAVVLAYAAGRRGGAQSEKDKAKARAAKADAARKDLDNEVSKLAPVERDRRLDRWMRD